MLMIEAIEAIEKLQCELVINVCWEDHVPQTNTLSPSLPPLNTLYKSCVYMEEHN